MQRVIPPWDRVAPPVGSHSAPPGSSHNPQYSHQPPPAFQQPPPAFHQPPSSFQQGPPVPGYPGPGLPGSGYPGYQQASTGGAPQFLQEAAAGGGGGWATGAAGAQSLAMGAAALMVGQQLGEAGFPKTLSGGGLSGGLFGAEGYLGSMRSYLNVSHRYVGERLVQLLVPFWGSLWGSFSGRGSSGYGGVGGGSSSSEFGSSEAALRLTAEPWRAPDLYIPLMALVSYVILSGARLGGSGDFHPDALYDTAAFAVLLVALEVAAARAACYLLGLASLAFWESAGVAGCKFVHLSVVLFFKLVVFRPATSLVAYWLLFAYMAGAAALATFNFLRTPLKTHHAGTSPATNYVLVALAGLQVPLLWLLQRA